MVGLETLLPISLGLVHDGTMALLDLIERLTVGPARILGLEVGRLAVGAITSAYYALAQGAILVLALSFLMVNLVVDVLYAFLDPRVRAR